SSLARTGSSQDHHPPGVQPAVDAQQLPQSPLTQCRGCHRRQSRQRREPAPPALLTHRITHWTSHPTLRPAPAHRNRDRSHQSLFSRSLGPLPLDLLSQKIGDTTKRGNPTPPPHPPHLTARPTTAARQIQQDSTPPPDPRPH